MSKRSTLLLFVASLVGSVLACAAWSETTGEANQQKARLATFDTSTGETYFALSLSPQAAKPPAPVHDIVVLFDTSASQTGIYRGPCLTRRAIVSYDEIDSVGWSEIYLWLIPRCHYSIVVIKHGCPNGNTIYLNGALFLANCTISATGESCC